MPPDHESDPGGVGAPRGPAQGEMNSVSTAQSKAAAATARPSADGALRTPRSRKSTGSIVEKPTKRGTSFGIRFRALGRRQWVHLGTDAEGWTRERAQEELAYVLAQVRRGEWEPDLPPEHHEPAPDFHGFATDWLAERAPGLRRSTVEGYRRELTHHLLPFFGRMRMDAIGVAEVDAYREAKLRQARQRRAAIEAGEPLTDRSGLVLRPLKPGTINATITRLGSILDVAHERGLIAQNPVRVNPRNRKAKASRPDLPWLEPDQMLALVEAAGRLDAADDRYLPTRRPLVATLAWAGLRIGEAAALRWRDVDLAGGTIRVRRSKTDAGVRDVDIQPELRDELLAWKAATPFGGRDDLVFPTTAGGPINRHAARTRVILRAVDEANAALERDGRPPLPEGLSPHALRRSFASWLLAEGEDVPYVQAQMGHADPTMTLGAYARAVRNGRRSARSRRRQEALDGALAGIGAPDAVPHAAAEELPETAKPPR